MLVIAAITKIGVTLSLVDSDLTQIWSPAGLTIVLIYFAGARFLPAVFAGVLVNYLFLLDAPPHAMLLAAGSTIEAYAGSWLLKKYSFQPTMKRLRDVGILIVVAGAVSTSLNALVAVSASMLFHPVIGNQAMMAAVTAWTGNFAGVVIIAPILFTLFSRKFEKQSARQLVEFAILLIAVFAISYSVFHLKYFTGMLNYSMAFILFPFAILSSIRFGMTGSVILTYIISLNATLSTQTELGLFASEDYVVSILLVDIFIIVLGSTSMALAALIDERAATEQSIRKSEENYRIITERTGQLLYDYNVKTGVIHWSGAITELTQYTPGEFSNFDISGWVDLIHPDDRLRADNDLAEAMSSHREYHIEYRFRRKDGTYFDVLDRGVFLYRTPTDTEAYRMLGTMADISPINRTLTKLRQSEERFRVLIEKSGDGILLLNKRGIITFVSESATSIIGYTPGEMLDTSIFEILHPSEAKQYAYKFGRLTVEFERSEYLLGRFRHKNGEWVFIEGMVTNLFNNPNVNAFVANFRNVTERINADIRLRQSLREKEILLKEVHHRVKNNMQVISSLLNLQASTSNSRTVAAVFRENQNRVKSMALVHEILYQSHDLASVNFSRYVRQLIESLKKSAGVHSGSITIAINVPSVMLDIDTVIPCGLIINELVSNSMKHAFPKKKKGTITVAMRKRASAFQLSVSDNGIGLPASAVKRPSLGLKLVQALTEQLKGTMKIQDGGGMSITIDVPYRKKSTT